MKLYCEKATVLPPNLARCVPNVLFNNPTEACVKRSFSHCGELHCDLQNHRNEDSAEALIFVKVNSGQLSS